MPKIILITGAAGFIGQALAARLLNDPSYQLILTDVIEPPIPSGVKYPENAKAIKADLTSPSSLSSVISSSIDVVYVFHGIMSSGAEANFDFGMKVNFDATRILLEALRSIKPGIRVLYASTEAVYGLPLPEVVDESITPTPMGSYGAEKLMCETLINEYNRRGFIDGFILRFPTISVRPGKPTAAASSFLSGLVREPLDGKECIIPLTDRKFESWLCSPKTLIANLEFALSVPSDALPSHIRYVNMPGICVSIQDMMDTLAKVGGEDKLKLLKEETDADTERIVRTWPTKFDNTLAFKLGFQKDVSFEQAVVDYKESITHAL